MNLKNHFIVAMPTITEPTFSRSVVYICEHNRDGAMGIVINKPIQDLNVAAVLARLEITASKNCAELEHPVFAGGPIAEEQGFILHTPQQGFASSIKISDDIMITTSLDLLKSIGSPEQPKDMFLALGYSGWQSLQLEAEVARNDWLVTDVDPKIIFESAIEDRWQKAAQSLGININTISHQMGNA
ncbi:MULTISPECIES: YqgE/AlgH family protein [unclassified Gilliamella]|uniref:YqgE/AlgH family protein n=1 Tax=unclassified Gilliamella TaxID=2685620 RepID=UPI00226A8DAF|nr:MULTISPECIES: YqgE/AlgH family protein [unclassified Gilliamella]MCX8642358.1 YqgE/AlgH family protein [Gilliamella sp. B3835]MCX8707756.1 YqgE/AlgH family protein [Gilliamella sp. B3783]MCX8709329.1 YqgE/AlgH family protein [Gilliamella sp. B3780]MCX8711630.1 YqgE/AlgH family protein [Gilliamella sp. B3468]MCX8715215.1 YqgE/AlgH family protein [Gilliamella sp. B3781]